MSFKTLKDNNSGFTLVELMVVVAIIGILSSVAIPSFKRYQAKAKTSEAKLHLASIYSAEVSFFSDADSYATCLGDMGYNPSSSQPQRYYATGFGAESSIAASDLINGISCDEDANFQFSAGKVVGGKTAVADDLGDTVTVSASGDGFFAGAVGVISAELGASATASVFKTSMEAYATSDDSSDDSDSAATSANAIKEIKDAIGDMGDHFSAWGVNDQKLIIEANKGY